ncbi:Hypothetical predicted protein, partial [Olea europaea subsp. europaea]
IQARRDLNGLLDGCYERVTCRIRRGILWTHIAVNTAISHRRREAMPALVDCMLGQTIRALTISTIMRNNTNGSPSRSCAGMAGVGAVRPFVSDEGDDHQ